MSEQDPLKVVKTHPYEDLVKKHPKLKKSIVQDWLNAAKWVADTYSQDPSTKTAALIISEENKLLSVGINGMPPGIEYPSDYDGDDPKWRQWRLDRSTHGEVSSIAAAANFGVACRNKIMVCTFYPCTPCLNTTHGAHIQTIVTDLNQLDPARVERWKESYTTAGEVLESAKNPEMSMFVLPMKPQKKLNLGMDKLHELSVLNGTSLGVAFAEAISYEDLLSWGKGGQERKLKAPELKSQIG